MPGQSHDRACADAAHHRVQILHFKGDVVEAGKARAGKGGGMMRFVAAHEDHALGAVGHAKAQDFLDDVAAGLGIGRVEDDMGELDRHHAAAGLGMAFQGSTSAAPTRKRSNSPSASSTTMPWPPPGSLLTRARR
jgi:hypothetical protein